MNEINIKIKAFGAFRKYFPEGIIDITSKETLTAKELRVEILKRLKQLDPRYSNDLLVYESAIAKNGVIIEENVEIKPSEECAILPPVCGG